MSGFWKPLVVLVSVLLLTAPIVYAQSQATTGVIEGRVTDESGAVLPGATVVLTNVDTNQERTLTTDDSGRYRGVLLPLGAYRVAVSLQGFTSTGHGGHRSRCRPDAHHQLRAVEPGAFEDEIVVQADTPSIETSRTDNAVTVGEDAMFGLPNNGRNFLDFTKLTPGCQHRPGPRRRRDHVNGQKGIQNNVSVDGADFNNPFFGEQRGGQRPGLHLQPRRGPGDGGGGRRRPGRVRPLLGGLRQRRHQVRHQRLPRHRPPLLPGRQPQESSAKNADGSAEPTSTRSSSMQGGFTLGGPIIRDKLFFFTALDVQRGESTKQTGSRPHRAAGGRLPSPRIGSPERERPDQPHRRRRGLPRQGRLAALGQQPRHLPLHLHQHRAGQRHLRRRLVGRERQRGRED